MTLARSPPARRPRPAGPAPVLYDVTTAEIQVGIDPRRRPRCSPIRRGDDRVARAAGRAPSTPRADRRCTAARLSPTRSTILLDVLTAAGALSARLPRRDPGHRVRLVGWARPASSSRAAAARGESAGCRPTGTDRGAAPSWTALGGRDRDRVQRDRPLAQARDPGRRPDRRGGRWTGDRPGDHRRLTAAGPAAPAGPLLGEALWVGPLVVPGRTRACAARDLTRTDADPAWPRCWPSSAGSAGLPLLAGVGRVGGRDPGAGLSRRAVGPRRRVPRSSWPLPTGPSCGPGPPPVVRLSLGQPASWDLVRENRME